MSCFSGLMTSSSFLSLGIIGFLGHVCTSWMSYLKAYSFFFLACGILVPRPGIEPMLPALGAQSLSHWTTWKVPKLILDFQEPQLQNVVVWLCVYMPPNSQFLYAFNESWHLSRSHGSKPQIGAYSY